jgi:hypothetical protein
VVVLLTVAFSATGIELWLFGFRFGSRWLTWHQATFVLWFLAMAVHVFAYLAGPRAGGRGFTRWPASHAGTPVAGHRLPGGA